MLEKTVYSKDLENFLNSNLSQFEFRFGSDYYCIHNSLFFNPKILAVVFIYKDQGDYFVGLCIGDELKNKFFNKQNIKKVYEIMFKRTDIIFAEAVHDYASCLLERLGFREYYNNNFILSKESVEFGKWNKTIKS